MTGIAADVTDSALQSLLQTLPGMGGMSVSRTGLCHSYVWTADWLQVGGDRPPITLNTRNIQVVCADGNGRNADIMVEIYRINCMTNTWYNI